MAHYCSNCATALEFERNLPVGSALAWLRHLLPTAFRSAVYVPNCSLVDLNVAKPIWANRSAVAANHTGTKSKTIWVK